MKSTRWSIRSSARSFAHIAHSIACSALLASLARSAALSRSLARESLCNVSGIVSSSLHVLGTLYLSFLNYFVLLSLFHIEFSFFYKGSEFISPPRPLYLSASFTSAGGAICFANLTRWSGAIILFMISHFSPQIFPSSMSRPTPLSRLDFA